MLLHMKIHCFFKMFMVCKFMGVLETIPVKKFAFSRLCLTHSPMHLLLAIISCERIQVKNSKSFALMTAPIFLQLENSSIFLNTISKSLWKKQFCHLSVFLSCFWFYQFPKRKLKIIITDIFRWFYRIFWLKWEVSIYIVTWMDL